MKRLGQEVSKRVEAMPAAGFSEREAVKESIKTIASESETDSAAGSSVPAQAMPAAAPDENFMPSYIADGSDPGAKEAIEKLLGIAATGDIVGAVRMAKKYPPFLEDAFHDALADKLIPELKKRGIIR